MYANRLWTSVFIIYFLLELNGFKFSLTRKKTMNFPGWLEFPDNSRFSIFPSVFTIYSSFSWWNKIELNGFKFSLTFEKNIKENHDFSRLIGIPWEDQIFHISTFPPVFIIFFIFFHKKMNEMVSNFHWLSKKNHIFSRLIRIPWQFQVFQISRLTCHPVLRIFPFFAEYFCHFIDLFRDNAIFFLKTQMSLV